MAVEDGDLLAGMVGLLDTLQAVESVPCKATQEVIDSLAGSLDSVRSEGCQCVTDAITALGQTLQSVQGAALGALSGTIARLEGLASTLPQPSPGYPEEPSGAPIPPEQEPSPEPPVPGPRVPGPAVPPVPAPRPAAACPRDVQPAPDDRTTVLVTGDCAREVTVPAGPIAIGQQNEYAYLAGLAGEQLAPAFAGWVDPITRAILAADSLDGLLATLLSVPPEE